MTLYDSPVNRFVAGFIGSPAMNFIEAKVIRDGGLYLDEGTFRANVPIRVEKALEPHVDKDVIFGVRPEAIHEKISGEPGDHWVGIKTKVEVVEPMGNETIIYVTTGNTPIVARLITRRDIKPDSDIDLFLDMRRVQFFDPLDEKTIV
jgi:multiple sugar transport system ATP-binding protein